MWIENSLFFFCITLAGLRCHCPFFSVCCTKILEVLHAALFPNWGNMQMRYCLIEILFENAFILSNKCYARTRPLQMHFACWMRHGVKSQSQPQITAKNMNNFTLKHETHVAIHTLVRRRSNKAKRKTNQCHNEWVRAAESYDFVDPVCERVHSNAFAFPLKNSEF